MDKKEGRLTLRGSDIRLRHPLFEFKFEFHLADVHLIGGGGIYIRLSRREGIEVIESSYTILLEMLRLWYCFCVISCDSSPSITHNRETAR